MRRQLFVIRSKRTKGKALFYRNALGQVPWLIHVKTLGYADVVSHELQGNYGKAGGKVLIYLGNIYGKGYGILNVVISIGGKSHEVSAAALAFYHIGDGLFIKLGLGEDTNHQSILLNEADGSVL